MGHMIHSLGLPKPRPSTSSALRSHQRDHIAENLHASDGPHAACVDGVLAEHIRFRLWRSESSDAGESTQHRTEAAHPPVGCIRQTVQSLKASDKARSQSDAENVHRSHARDLGAGGPYGVESQHVSEKMAKVEVGEVGRYYSPPTVLLGGQWRED